MLLIEKLLKIGGNEGCISRWIYKVNERQ